MKSKRWISGLSVLILSIVLCACQAVQTSADPALEENGVQDVDVMMIDDQTITSAEAYTYLYLMQKNYEYYYGHSIWQTEHPDGGTWEDWLRNETGRQITEIELLSRKAQSEGLSLDEEQKQEADQGAAKMLETIGSDISKQYGLSTECVENVYEKSMLAGIYYQSVLDSYEVSLTEDEEAACEAVDVMQLFIPADESEHLSEGQTALQLAEELRQRLEDGEDFETMAKAYSPETTQYEFVMNREGYVFDTDAWLEETFTKAAWELEAGEISPVVETSYGYHILKCVAVNSDALKQKAEAYSLEEKKKQLFAAEYENWLANTVCTEMPEWQKIHVLEGI
jgi:foldase protein PrsA